MNKTKMLILALAFFASCWLTTFCDGAELVVPVEVQIESESKEVPVEVISRVANESIQPMDCIRIWLDDIPAEGIPTIKWGCHPEPKLIQVGRTIDDNRPFLIFQAGKANSFGLFISSYHTAENQLKKYVIITGEPNPHPFPNPDPIPPTPSGPRWVIFVEEKSDRSKFPYMTTILENEELLTHLKDNQHQFRAMDKDQKAEWFLPFKDLVQKKKIVLPAIVITDSETGKVLFVGACPKTPGAVLNLVKKGN